MGMPIRQFLWILAASCSSFTTFNTPKQSSFSSKGRSHAITSVLTARFLSIAKVVDGPFEPQQQLQGIWCQSPLLIRQAFSSVDASWPSWQDILDLAHEEDTGESSRLITHSDGPDALNSFQLTLGPIKQQDFKSKIRQQQYWTLLVNDVDRYRPSLADWMDRTFPFLPRWRRDDAQVSIAPHGGGIGPHVDNYDVFLIQTSGKRQWKIGLEKMSVREEMEALIPDLSVRILSRAYDFEELVLEPGDMLYLPPRTVHWGTALSDDCVTLSVGCRAPSAAELVARVAEAIGRSHSDRANARYSDPGLISDISLQQSVLSDTVKHSMKLLVLDAVEEFFNDTLAWDELVGRQATEPVRYMDGTTIPYEELGDDKFYNVWGSTPRKAVQKIINGEGRLVRPSGLCCVVSSTVVGNDTCSRLFVHGEQWELWNEEIADALFQMIAHGEAVSAPSLKGASTDLLSVLEELVDGGYLRPVE